MQLCRLCGRLMCRTIATIAVVDGTCIPQRWGALLLPQTSRHMFDGIECLLHVQDFPTTHFTFEAWISSSDFCHAGEHTTLQHYPQHLQRLLQGTPAHSRTSHHLTQSRSTAARCSAGRGTPQRTVPLGSITTCWQHTPALCSSRRMTASTQGHVPALLNTHTPAHRSTL